jgi:ABC-type multidrug transport system ATPase subunit
MGGILAAFLLDVFVFLLVWIGRMADLRAATAAAAAAAAAGVGVGASSRRASAAFLALGGSSPRNEDDEDDALPPIDLATTTSAAAICDVVAEIRPLGMTLCAVNIVHVVGRGKGRREVLCGVSTAALPAKLTAIMGPSGAGKTCLLKCLAGMITPSSGTVTASVTAVDGPLAGLSGKTQQAFTASHVLSLHPVPPLPTRDYYTRTVPSLNTSSRTFEPISPAASFAQSVCIDSQSRICDIDARAGFEVSLAGSSCSMVPQDDVLFPHLTVRENVMHAARVRLPRTWETARVAAFVDLLLADLGLTAVLHSVVDDGVIGSRGISGGERKRTSIAVGMAAAPSLLLVDEPTSGLDATSALQVCRLLKRLAEGGLTVVVVLHQPRTEIWEAVDRVVLLQRGSVVFEGTQEDATALALATAATAERATAEAKSTTATATAPTTAMTPQAGRC